MQQSRAAERLLRVAARSGRCESNSNFGSLEPDLTKGPLLKSASAIGLAVQVVCCRRNITMPS